MKTEKTVSAPQLVSIRDAATRLNICEKTLWSLSTPRGPIPVVRIGRRTLYDPGDLARYVESCKD